ncbi:unnamed protein product, partial [Sphacelaria rigidula]
MASVRSRPRARSCQGTDSVHLSFLFLCFVFTRVARGIRNITLKEREGCFYSMSERFFASCGTTRVLRYYARVCVSFKYFSIPGLTHTGAHSFLHEELLIG